MKNLVKSAVVIGQVLGLLVGSKFTTPTSYVMGDNPYIFLYER
jgi:hypothetical protein